MSLKALDPKGSAPGLNSKSYDESHMKGYDKGGSRGEIKISRFTHFRGTKACG